MSATHPTAVDTPMVVRVLQSLTHRRSARPSHVVYRALTTEQRPSPRPVRRHERERRIAARDQQIDRRVIALVQNDFQ